MGHNKRLIENIGSLTVLQGANYILPLIILPYLVRVLGPEKFGLIAFAQAFTQYFVILTDYGFNLSATRQIAIHRDDSDEVSKIFSSVMTIKFGLMLVSFLVMSAIVLAVPKFHAEWLVYFVTFLSVLGNVLFPVWFYQGMEKMRYIAMLNIAAKLMGLIALFIFVQHKSDYLIAIGIQSSTNVVAGLLGLMSFRRVSPIRYAVPSRDVVVLAFKEGWHVFISTAAISVYATSNTFILGLITNNTIVGYYSAADKLTKAVQSIFSPVHQALYPHISNLVAQSREVAMDFIRRSLRWLGAIALVVSMLLFAFAGPLVMLLLGAQYTASVVLVRWMAFLPFIIMFGNVFGMQTMLPFGMNKLFSRIIVLAALADLVYVMPLTYVYGAEGAAIAMLLTEMIVALTMGTALRRKGFRFFELRKGAD